MQLLGCRAQLQATKQSFMLLSRAFSSWQQLVALRRRLEAVTDTLQVGGGRGINNCERQCSLELLTFVVFGHHLCCVYVASASFFLRTQAHRHRQATRAALLCWQEYVQHQRRKRQLLLHAEACYVFMTLLRVLQHWRARTTDKQLARLRAARCGVPLLLLLGMVGGRV